jgi:hypothetical protein
MTISTEEAERLAKYPHRRQEMTARDAIRFLAAERDALQKRVVKIKEALEAAALTLHEAGEKFASYANQHAAKGTAGGDQKAATNQQWAQRCFSAHDAALEAKKDESP